MKLALDKFILSGHSFGGLTALCTAREDSRVRLVSTLDPFLFSHTLEIGQGELSLTVPQQAISTEMFHPSISHEFPSWDTLKALLASAQNKRIENVLVRNTAHLHQCDLASLVPLELYLMYGKIPRTTTNQAYQLMSQLMLSFFSRSGFASKRGDPKRVEEYIKAMKAKWLQYDISL